MLSEMFVDSGGVSYIGSRTCVELLNARHLVVDNLANSSKKPLERVQQITGKAVSFYCIDLLDKDALDKVFVAH